ncbi:hypothetical protein V8F33_001461 [Rhypophila sp. PSN 637]
MSGTATNSSLAASSINTTKMEASSQPAGSLSERPEGMDVVPNFIPAIFNLPDIGPPYRSWKELRTENVRVSYSPIIKRLFRPLQGDFPAAISVMKSRRGARLPPSHILR